MPHIAITMYPGRSDEIKKDLALKIQTLVTEELKVDKKVVSVSVEDVAKEDWEEHMKKFPDEIIYAARDV